MQSTYHEHASICAKFYALTINNDVVSDFVISKSHAKYGEKVLFVGGMFEIALKLIQKGFDVTVVDYTDEMLEEGRKILPHSRVLKADLSDLSFQSEFDLIFVVGRVFTHMISDASLSSAIAGCKRALLPNGRLFADNYEDYKIQKTDYFNGKINCSDSSCEIIRESNTELLTTSPFVVRWNAKYSGVYNGQPFNFFDSMEHRAFSREEFSSYLTKAGFNLINQGDNFDETSFYTLAQI